MDVFGECISIFFDDIFDKFGDCFCTFSDVFFFFGVFFSNVFLLEIFDDWFSDVLRGRLALNDAGEPFVYSVQLFYPF